MPDLLAWLLLRLTHLAALLEQTSDPPRRQLQDSWPRKGQARLWANAQVCMPAASNRTANRTELVLPNTTAMHREGSDTKGQLHHVVRRQAADWKPLEAYDIVRVSAQDCAWERAELAWGGITGRTHKHTAQGMREARAQQLAEAKVQTKSRPKLTTLWSLAPDRKPISVAT